MLNVKTIPRDKGFYLAGFADGEGSFMVVIRKKTDYSIGYKISVCFNVSQTETYILSQFKTILKCGTLRTRKDDVSYYEVNNFNAIVENIIPFFKHFAFLSTNKKLQFAKFCQVVELMQKGDHLTEEGFYSIVKIRETMNRGGKSSRKHFKN